MRIQNLGRPGEQNSRDWRLVSLQRGESEHGQTMIRVLNGVTNFGQTKLGQEVLPSWAKRSWASTNFGPTKFGQHQVGQYQVWPEFDTRWGEGVGGPGCPGRLSPVGERSRWGAVRVGPRREWGPEGLGGPKCRAFFPLPRQFSFFLSSLGGSSRGILVVFLKAGTLKRARLGSRTPNVHI